MSRYNPADSLAIYLYGAHVATVQELRPQRPRLQYTEASRDRWGDGTPLLSVNLPLDPTRDYPPGATAAFLDGFLPEEPWRTVIERGLGVPFGNSMQLLRLLGRDCAGAMIVQPESAPPPAASLSRVKRLNETELIEAVRALPQRPMCISNDNEVRLSLAGVQEKLLLAVDSDGSFGLPLNGSPSTHILKPSPRSDRVSVVYNEALCMRAAKHLGLTNVDVETMVLQDGMPALLVPRYDRRVGEGGIVYRQHQEDMCQALGILVGKGGQDKYERGGKNKGGVSLRGVAGILAAHTQSPGASLERLLRLVTLNVLLGNADAHGKNMSLLHLEDGTVQLAPSYDIVCTVYGGFYDTKMGMFVNGKQDIHSVGVDDIVMEALQWGDRWTSERHARDVVRGTLEEAGEALDFAAQQTTEAPEELVDLIQGRRVSMLDGLEAGHLTQGAKHAASSRSDGGSVRH